MRFDTRIPSIIPQSSQQILPATRSGAAQTALPPECSKSPTHMQWCEAVLSMKAPPSGTPPAEVMALMMQLASRDPKYRDYLERHFPKAAKQLGSAERKYGRRLPPGEMKKLAKKVLREMRKQAKRSLRRERKQAAKSLRKERKRAASSLRKERKKAGSLRRKRKMVGAWLRKPRVKA